MATADKSNSMSTRLAPAADGPGGPAFGTTHWSAVAEAGGVDPERAAAALESLCRTYWTPLYAFARRMGQAPAEAQDLTQSFFVRLLTRQTVAAADPGRGRFRSFLLASFKHFLAHEWEKARAEKRGGGIEVLPLEFGTAEMRCVPVAAAEVTPDRAFDRQWALALLETVLGRLRAEYRASGRDALFLGLKETLAGGRAELSYRELGRQLGMSEGAVKIAAHRLRHRYRELLREEIGRTLVRPEDTEEELRHLFAALSG